MARQLGFQPKSLIKNIPSRSQKWKMPVRDWVTSLYEKKFGAARPARSARAAAGEPPKVIEFRNPEHPWPDKPEIPELTIYDPTEPAEDDEDQVEWSDFPFREPFGPPPEAEIDEQNNLLLRRQCLFRWAAQLVAIAMSKLPEVQKVAAFGAAARPLEMEVPRFREFRRHGLKVLHECADLDLAVWMTDLSRLKELKSAIGGGLSAVQNTPYGGVAHHQVDVYLFDAGTGAYRGRLCYFGQCPKPRKRECLVPGCGKQPFLRQLEKWRFNPGQFETGPKAVLFDRAAGFLVRPPRMDAKPARIVPRPRGDGENPNDEEPPF